MFVLYHLLFCDPRRTTLSSLSLHFFICKMGVIISTAQGWCGLNCGGSVRNIHCSSSFCSPIDAVPSISPPMVLAMQSCPKETLMSEISAKGPTINSAKLRAA